MRKIRRIQVDAGLAIQKGFDRLRDEINIVPEQAVTVSPTGGQFTSIKDAVDAIDDASTAKPYGILVMPGVYVEQPITMKPFINIECRVPGSAIVVAADPNSPLFTMAEDSGIKGLTVNGPANDSAFYAAGGTVNTGAENCQVLNCTAGFHATGAGTVLLVEECKALNATVGTCLLAEGGARIGAANILSYASTAFASYTGATLWFQNSAAVRCANGILADDSGLVQCVGITIEDATVAAIRTGPNGTNLIVGAGITCFSNTLDVLQEAAGSNIELGASFMDADRFSVQEWSDITISFDGQEQGRYLQTVAKDLSVGVPQLGRHSYMGEGEPYTRGMMVYTTDATASPASDGGNLIDVSAEARSLSGSTFTMQGLAADHAILIGSSLADGDVQEHVGLWINQTVGAVETVAKSFIIEIWDGAAWVEVGCMAICPCDFHTYGKSLFLRTGEEMIHFGITTDTTWVKKTIDGHNLYWSRIRNTQPLTTAPVFEQFRLLPNHMTVHTDGTATFHGTSRFQVTLVGLGNIFGENGTVVDGSVNVGSGGGFTGWTHNCKNSEFNTNGDAINWQFPIPLGVDTSLPLSIEATLVPTVGTAGTVTMVASLLANEVAGILVADPSGGRDPIVRTVANTEALTSKQAQYDTQTFTSGVTDKPQQVTFGPFDIVDYYPGDILCLRLEMEDDGAGSANVLTLTAEVSGSKWHLGQKN